MKYILGTINQISNEFKHGETEVNIDAIKEDILDIIEDTLANMQPPNAFDHIAGAVGQFIQYKLMKSVQMDELLNPQITQGLNTAEI